MTPAAADTASLVQPLVRSAVPTFIVPDVAAAARWYVEHLGFQIAGTVPEAEPWGFASISLGSAELMLIRLDGYQRPLSTAERPEWMWDAYIRMDGVRAYCERLRNAPFVIAPLRKQRHGDWEFDVRDPNGYVLVFGGDAHH